MLSHWRTWRTAWVEAAYGPHGFWTREHPGRHFATGVGLGPLVARAIASLAPPGVAVVADVGAGDGALLTQLSRLMPGVDLVGVDRRPRPPGLAASVRWCVDHLDVDEDRWSAGGPDAWLADAGTPLLVAHEWVDDLPVPVVTPSDDGWREVEVDVSGGERPGPSVLQPDAAWLARWWPDGNRAEVGRGRDAAWSALVAAALRRGGSALAVDYGHQVSARPQDGSLTAYADGRQRRPVPDGTVNLTAGVAVDALAAAGEAVGATTLLLERQAAALADIRPDETIDPLSALARRSERAALRSPSRWGDLWWLLQGPPT